MAAERNRNTTNLPADLARRLDDLRLGLLGVHKALLDHERIRYERANGRVPGSGDFLQLAIHDPWFAWLHPLSELVVQVDELAARAEPAPATTQEVDTLVEEARTLLRPDEHGEEFQRRYFRALQDAPEVGMVHATWKRLTSTAPPADRKATTTTTSTTSPRAAAAASAAPVGTVTARPAPRPIDPATRIGHVHLKVADLERALGFYVGVLGFQLTQRYGAQAAFVSAGGYHHHLGLNTWESRGGSAPPPGTTGLYHAAILYPTRAALADALRRLAAANIPLDGASDHGVSEALYLRDPDGNGLELYWDRPREQWPRSPDGGVAMYTRTLDLNSLLAEPPVDPPR